LPAEAARWPGSTVKPHRTSAVLDVFFAEQLLAVVVAQR
jgi:hypothetical protein